MKKSIALRACLSLTSLAATAAGLHARTGSRPPTVHVFVALADNKNQGIVPVPARLGNGQDPENNLYWGAAFGVKAFFRKSSEWKTLSCTPGPSPAILERCIFRRSDPDGYLVADAYDGAIGALTLRGRSFSRAYQAFLSALRQPSRPRDARSSALFSVA